MKQYIDLLRHIRNEGENRPDRTGTGTRSIFGYQIRFPLNRFPLLTTKKVNIKAVIYELLWFLKGSSNIRYLNENGVHIWDEWADEDGELGPVYGKQWRKWIVPNKLQPVGSTVVYFIDQIADVIKSIKENPYSRRHIVTAWNPADVDDMALPPCHMFFQFYVTVGKYDGIRGLSCQMYQRSADVFLGVPFNIASYALLTMMIAQVCDLVPKELIIDFGDVHIYKNHFDVVDMQILREPRELPLMLINKNVKDIDNFRYKDFTLQGYDPHPALRGEISV